MKRMALAASLACGAALLPAGAAEPQRAMPQRGSLGGRRPVVGAIIIHVQPVFDLDKPSENNWLGRAANRIHVSTREGVVRRALLFKEGDRIRGRQLYESERLLRALPFVKDARILADPAEGDPVTVQVWVRDAWTIELDAGYQQVGGQRTTHFGIQDQNVLGTGKTVGVSITKDHERTDSQLSYGDPQLFGSRWTLAADYRKLSDGYARRLAVNRPFFALSTPWAATLEGETRRSTQIQYDQGKAVYQVPYWANTLRLATAWTVRQEEDRAWRAGVAFAMEDRRYGPVATLDPATTLPGPILDGRRQRGPALTLAYQQDAYQSFQDIQGMDTPEDYNLAWTGALELGSYSRRLGSTRPGPYLKLQLAKAWSGSPRRLTLFNGKAQARSGGVEREDFLVEASVATYFQSGPARGLAAYLGGSFIHRPDPEHLLYVGGAEGLRGYPNFLHPGDAQWVASVEQRFFTEQRWWGLFRLGYVVFLDLGAVHRLDGKGWSPVYPDLGVGLRLGDLKSSLARVLAFTLAVPLERQPGQSRWQFGVGTTVRF